MKNEELKRILENHMHWLKQDCKGCENMRADLHDTDLHNADLRNADLRSADLRYADLRYADLRYADLRSADLNCADLSDASLCGANLYYADLRGANLHNADLCGANLHNADLCGANLHNADLCGANLYYADLRGANLHNADLCGANLHNADLLGANLNDAKCIPYIPLACPEAGSFVAFKKARGFIIKLEIPEDAKRLSATTNKCRCNKAKVLEIQNVNGTAASISEVSSGYDKTFIYKVGETVTVMDFDDNRWNECSTGIHFFINRQEAVNYF